MGLFDGGDGGVAESGNFGVGEGAIGSSEAETEGQAASTLAEASERNSSNTSIASRTSLAAAVSVATTSWAFVARQFQKARSIPAAGYGDGATKAWSRRGSGDERVDVDLEGDEWIRGPEGRGDGRCQLPHHAHVGPRDLDASGASGMEAFDRGGHHAGVVDAERVEHCAQPVGRVVHVNRAVVLHWAATPGARTQRGDVTRLVRQQRITARREEDPAELEEGDVAHPSGGIGAGDAEQAREQSGSQDRFLGP